MEECSNDTLLRKRVGRPPKKLCGDSKGISSKELLSSQVVNISEDLDVPSPISSVSSASEDTMERRRSSRKKVIKFDVRDLLNKNRKTHKIQIEARIDSNAPSDLKLSSNVERADGTSSTEKHLVTSDEILVKKKTFMEKSAIFRRYSISADQPKSLPLPPPPLINNAAENKQNKPTCSLILAQMENANNLITVKDKKKRQSGKTPTVDFTNLSSHESQQQKKRGRPPKNKVAATITSVKSEEDNFLGLPIQEVRDSHLMKEEPNTQWLPKNVTNWKEYKAAIHHSTRECYMSAKPNENALIEIPVSGSTFLGSEEIVTTESQLPIEVIEPDITSSPYEEIIIETTTSPSAIIETNTTFFHNNFYNNVNSPNCINECSKVEDYKSDERGYVSSSANSLLNNVSTNAQTNNLRDHSFINDKLKVNVKRMPLPKSPSTIYNMNSNEDISKDKFDVVNSDNFNNTEVEDAVDTEEHSEQLCNLNGHFTYKVPNFSSDISQESDIDAENLAQSPFINQINSVNNTEVVEEEEYHDAIVMSDDNFVTSLIVIDELSSDTSISVKTSEAEQKDCRPHIPKIEKLSGNNQTKNIYQSTMENQYTQAAQEGDTVQDDIVVVDVEQSANTNSAVNVVLVGIDNQSNIKKSCDLSNVKEKIHCLNFTKQTADTDHTNAAEGLIKEVSCTDYNKNNKSLESIIQFCNDINEPHFKNMYNSETNTQIFHTSRVQSGCETNIKESLVECDATEDDTQCELSRLFPLTEVVTTEQLQNDMEISERNFSKNTKNFDNNTLEKIDIKTTARNATVNEKGVLKTGLQKEIVQIDKSPCNESEVVKTQNSLDAEDLDNNITTLDKPSLYTKVSNVNSNTAAETTLDTKFVHQVHIETNTLIDILRQVQTNCEANEAILNKNDTDTFIGKMDSNQNLENKGKSNLTAVKTLFHDDFSKNDIKRNDEIFSETSTVNKETNEQNIAIFTEKKKGAINEIESTSEYSTLTLNVMNKPTIYKKYSKGFEQSAKNIHSKVLKHGEKAHVKKLTIRDKGTLPNKSNKMVQSDLKKEKKFKTKIKHKVRSKREVKEDKQDTTDPKLKISLSNKPLLREPVQYQALNENKGTQNQANGMEEKLAKKKRQNKLKEAFEAALADNLNNKNSSALVLSSETTEQGKISTISSKSVVKESFSTEIIKETVSVPSISPIVPSTNVEDDSDPLKDIEKFIEDGVNLLKKGYKIDQNSIDVVVSTKTNELVKQNNNTNENTVKEEQEVNTILKKENEISKEADIQQEFFFQEVINAFETPADTPIATPSVTPPPTSPTPNDISLNSYSTTDIEENSGVRRSHRIKQITKAPKALVGRGLVRDRERFSIKDDVETKSHYSLDDHLTDLAEVEAKNAKFLKDMEERLSNFHVIKENEYKCERVVSREAKKMICDCFLTIEEEERGELACGEDCLNRLLMIECGPDCNVKERCTNKRFQRSLGAPCRVFRTEKKGFGILADIEILPGEFIMEYVGEVIDNDEFERRRITYSRDKNRHYYFMALRSDAIIDATIKGNISRFINHSCEPNAETQKWTVNGELRIGFFSRKSIMPGEEITFDYQYQRYGREAQRCYCESTNCRGWIGQEPTSDEGEQADDDSDYEEDEDEEDSTNLLVGEDDEDDSDASVPDPEEVRKKLEMAAAEAEAELAPITLDETKMKELQKSKKSDINKSQPDNDLEDSKSKFKNLLNKMAEKVAAKQKQNKIELRLQRKKKTKKKGNELPSSNKQRSLEDPDIEGGIKFLKQCGVKNQSDTLRLSRLMVRAKLVQTRLNLLEILRKGDLPCRRLFLDYHGLRLVHGWMSEDGGNMQIRMALLQTLETLPIANKTILTDAKVLQVVRTWCGSERYLSPNDDSSKESCTSTSNYSENVGNSTVPENSDSFELQKLASKLVTTWEGLPEIFRIPKKERIEQMKEHEREADRQYAASAQNDASNSVSFDRYQRDRFGRGLPSSYNRFVKPNNMKTINTLIGLSNINRVNDESMKHLSKAQRRKMFAAKVAQEEADKRLAEERREFETKCRFFGLDTKTTRPQDIPFCVNQFTGQWYSLERKPIATPPIYAHVQIPFKAKSTDPADYQLPSVVEKLPPQWKYAITPQGKIYYYHVKYRIPQWDPPTAAQLKHCELETNGDDSETELSFANDSSDDDDDILIGMDVTQLIAYIEKKVEDRRQKRYQRLVDERTISPRREEDRIYNQMEVRKYKENKEKIRKRKEGIRRKRAEALRQSASQNVLTVTDEVTNSSQNSCLSKISLEKDEISTAGVLPIQDYLLSSDEEDDIKAECNNSPLIDKIVEGDKIVDELDALTTKRPLKRLLPPHRSSHEASTSSTASSVSNVEKPEHKKRKTDKKEKRRSKDNDVKYRKLKEKFRCQIAGIIVHHLKPYRKDTCTIGRIQSNEDFNHLARKLTHFVMIKELKYCESVGQTLIVTESVKNKSREFIKKYMAKYGEMYVKPNNDPEFKDIPYTL